MSISKNKHSNLEYNNTCKRARITILKSELDKCMINQPFEINYQLPKKKKISLEDIMDVLNEHTKLLKDHGDRIIKLESRIVKLESK